MVRSVHISTLPARQVANCPGTEGNSKVGLNRVDGTKHQTTITRWGEKEVVPSIYKIRNM